MNNIRQGVLEAISIIEAIPEDNQSAYINSLLMECLGLLDYIKEMIDNEQ